MLLGETTNHSAQLPPPPGLVPHSLPEFNEAYGESLDQALDLATWHLGEDLLASYGRLEAEVSLALERESQYRKSLRDAVFPLLHTSPGAPDSAGVYQASQSSLEQIHRGLLFSGAVEAANGISVVHSTLPLSITQVGVCLVTYDGNQGTWAHRMFRRDLRAQYDIPVQEVLDVLRRRQRRSDNNPGDDALSNLARRGILAYAERAMLRDRSDATWRMGHGNPVPFELISGLWISNLRNLRMALDLVEWYVENGRFVFVPNRTQKRHLLMIGYALRPLEYAIVGTLEPEIRNIIDLGHYRDEGGVRPEMERFCAEVAPSIVIGVFRVWGGAPPCLFYAHANHVHVAAHIAMADAMLQQYRGFPMLLDLANVVCRTTFGVDSLIPGVQSAYADAGAPMQSLGDSPSGR
jgi:hypothetical protein